MEITAEQKRKIAKIAKKYGLKLVLLFGSHVSGRARKDSDFDVAVLTEANKNIGDLKNYNNALFTLSEILKIPSQKIDLTNLNSANPLLSYQIIMNSQLVFGNKNLFDEYRARAFKDYIDAQPLFNLEHRLIEKRQQALKNLIQSNG